MWIALTDCTERHGPMLHLSKSHLAPLLKHEDVSVIVIVLPCRWIAHAPVPVLCGSNCPRYLPPRSSEMMTFTCAMMPPHHQRYDPDNLLTRGQTITALKATGPTDLDVVSGVLSPGMMSIHHLCTAHGGGPNTALTRRIGFNVCLVLVDFHAHLFPRLE